MSNQQAIRARILFVSHSGEIIESLIRATDRPAHERVEHLTDAFNLLLECASATMDAITKEAGTPSGAAATVERLKQIAERG